MLLPNIPFNVLPLSWLGWKRRPTQFADNKNTPGIDYDRLKADRAEMLKLSAEAEAKSAEEKPKETNGERILIVDDGGPTARLLAAMQNDLAAGPLEMPELPQPE